MTPTPTGIEALLCELEAKRTAAVHLGRYSARGSRPALVEAYRDALVNAAPSLFAALRSQSRALAEREERIWAQHNELQKLRLLLRFTRGELASRVGVIDEALASAPKGEGEG